MYTRNWDKWELERFIGVGQVGDTGVRMGDTGNVEVGVQVGIGQVVQVMEDVGVQVGDSGVDQKEVGVVFVCRM